LQLEKNIGELLYCHDCVIVPNFGGFVANYRSAWIDELRQKVHPPSKEIGFNRNLQRNDGLLVDHFAQAERISFNEAGELIAEQIGLWNKKLESGERVELSGIGGLYFDRARNLHFDPDISTNYLTSSFAMGAVQLPKLNSVPVEVPEPVVEELPGPIVVPLKVLQKHEDTEERSRVVWPAMAASVAILIAFGFWLSTRTSVIQDGMAALSGLELFKSAPAPVYTEHELSEIEVLEYRHIDIDHANNEDHFSYSFTEHSEVPSGRVIEWNIPKPVEPVHTAVVTPAVEFRYHVVGGCFSEEGNALGLIQKLQAEGYEPRLIDKRRGLHRVAVGSYLTKRQALKALAAVRKEHTPSAWLLVK